MSNSPEKPDSDMPPVKIRVLGKRFEIKEIEPDNSELHDCDGLMELASHTIWWRPQPSEEYNQDTILHELTHAVDEILCLGMKERQVHLIASGLLAVLKENPELAKWLLK